MDVKCIISVLLAMFLMNETEAGNISKKKENVQSNQNVCSDKSSYCSTWAKANQCKRNKSFMEKHCCSSCGFNNVKKITVTRKHKYECSDKSSYCSTWAKQGLCNEKYKPFMREKCCLSCYQFYKKPYNKTKQSNCLDLKKKCSFWAHHGLCSRNQAYMSRKCCLSCENLTTNPLTFSTTSTTDVRTTPATTAAPNVCLDKNRLCSSWSKQGYCHKKRIYMKENCCESCASS